MQKPLEYTEEELRALNEPMMVEGEGGVTATVPGVRPPLDAEAERRAKAQQAILESIPTTREGIWSYPVKWEAYDPSSMKEKVTKWVAAKVKELLGMTEDSLVSYVIELIEARAKPQKMFEELSPVLDADTESFCLKLYRVVIFETESAAATSR